MVALSYKIKKKPRYIIEFDATFNSVTANQDAFPLGFSDSVINFHCGLCDKHREEIKDNLIFKGEKVCGCSVLGCKNLGKKTVVSTENLHLSDVGTCYVVDLKKCLGEQFLKDMQVEVEDVTLKAEVLELLYLVVSQYYKTADSVVLEKITFTSDLLNTVEGRNIVRLMYIAGAYSNDLMFAVLDTLQERGIKSKLTNLSDSEAWAVIHNWVLNTITIVG